MKKSILPLAIALTLCCSLVAAVVAKTAINHGNTHGTIALGSEGDDPLPLG